MGLVAVAYFDDEFVARKEGERVRLQNVFRRLEKKGVNIDTPTAISGGILASFEVACCCRSYTRSTSVLLPVCPTAKLKKRLS